MSNLQFDLSEKKKTKAPLSITGLLTAALLYFGLGGCLFHALIPAALSSEHMILQGFLLSPTGISRDSLILAGIGAGLMLLFFFLSSFRIGRILGALTLGITFIVSIVFFDLAGGICSIFNQVSDSLGSHLSRNLTQLAGNDAALGVALFWAGILLSFVCIWIVSTRNALFAWITGLLFLALLLLLDFSVPAFCFPPLFAGLFLMRLPDSVQQNTSRAGIRVTLLLCTVYASAVFLLGTICLPSDTLRPVHVLHEQLFNAVSIFRYGTDSDTGMPEGNFTNLGSLVQTDSPMLEITMDDPDSYYLRGYVGSDYQASSWKEADPVSLYDGAELFYWLHRFEFFGTTQLANVAGLLNENDVSEKTGENGAETDDKDNFVKMSVVHTGASTKYLYAPYELYDSDLLDPDHIGDIRLTVNTFRHPSEYTLKLAHNQVKRYATLSSLLKILDEAGTSGPLSDYLTLESHYNRFVYDHFLTVPEDLIEVLSELLGKVPENNNQKHIGYALAKQMILSCLNDNIHYAEVIGTHDSSKDFLIEFLSDTKAGYDVHYASAAVMMMRYLGIPARYVEGFLITPETVSAAKPDQPILLTEEASHAWVEYYQDGIGWIPFEVTPKYLDVMEQEDDLYGSGTNSEYQSDEQDAPNNNDENSLDMEDDAFDDEPEDNEEEEAPDIITPIIHLIVTVGAAILLLLLLCYIIWRIANGIRRYISFHQKNRKEAVKNLYTELHHLMGCLYHWPDCTQPYFFTETIRSDLGETMAATYKDILCICEKAAFSSYQITEDEYLSVLNFVKQTRKLSRKRRRFSHKKSHQPV